LVELSNFIRNYSLNSYFHYFTFPQFLCFGNGKAPPISVNEASADGYSASAGVGHDGAHEVSHWSVDGVDYNVR
jgi:hypothetical protein